MGQIHFVHSARNKELFHTCYNIYFSPLNSLSQTKIVVVHIVLYFPKAWRTFCSQQYDKNREILSNYDNEGYLFLGCK